MESNFLVATEGRRLFRPKVNPQAKPDLPRRGCIFFCSPSSLLTLGDFFQDTFPRKGLALWEVFEGPEVALSREGGVPFFPPLQFGWDGSAVLQASYVSFWNDAHFFFFFPFPPGGSLSDV